MNEKRKRKPLILIGGMLLLLLTMTAVLAGAIAAAPSAVQDGGEWFWQTTHTVAEADTADEELVVVEGQVGEIVDPAGWNRYTFSADGAEILANFADDIPDGAIPKGVTVRIFGEAEDGEVDVQGLEVLQAVSLTPSATAEGVNSGDFNQQQVSVRGEVGEKQSDVQASWNYFAFTDGSGTTTVDLPDTDEMPDELIPAERIVMIFGQAKDSDRVDSDHILLAQFGAEEEEAPADSDSVTMAPAAVLGAAGALVAGIPEPAGATYQTQDLIQEGGRHFFYTTTEAPNAVVRAFGTALESTGWTIEYSGGGGDPFGLFGGGAGLTATKDGRYLKFNAGGPVGKTYIDACVWPSQPDDDDCGQNQDQTSDGSPALGANADLLAGVPEPAKAEFKSENAIQENGRHYFYFSSENAPSDVIAEYQAALEAAGWTIEDSGSGGDPFGLFGSGANVTATKDGRYLKAHAGGPPGSTFMDTCIWPTQPDDDDCDQDQQNQDSAALGVMGTGGDLLAGIPEPANADFQSENAMPEGGRHFFYTSGGAPADIVGKFLVALEEAGWTIEDSGGGGDPFGFASGAGLTATNGGRYLKFNAGGPAGQSYIDACVWPTKPGDDDCDQNNRQTTGTALLGASGALLAGVPELTGADFKSEDAIQEGGRHYFFFSSENTPADIVSGYETALTDAGWNILNSGGDPFGLFGAGLTASDGTRYLKLNAGGPQGSAFVDGCIWPARPSDDNCVQNNQTSGSARLGAGGALLANVPEPGDAAFQAQDSIQEGGRHFYYTTSNAPADVVSNYQTALEANGWTVVDSGGGGDPFGFASGAGLTATNGSRYLKMNAGGPTGSTHVDVCVWPFQPQDNNCGQNSNQNSAGNAVLGSSGGLMTGVPELQEAEFKAEDAIHEGGRHFFFTSTDSPGNVISGYEALLAEAGWEIVDSGGGGDPFGFFGGGAGLTATDGARVIKLNAGGPAGQTFIDGCVWPTAPVNDNCGQNSDQ